MQTQLEISFNLKYTKSNLTREIYGESREIEKLSFIHRKIKRNPKP
jgi:hypothetical protein